MRRIASNADVIGRVARLEQDAKDAAELEELFQADEKASAELAGHLEKIGRELDALEAFGIDIANYLFLPRILAVMVSVMLLSALFAIIVTFSGLIFSTLIFDMGFNAYADIIAKAIEYKDFLILAVKSAALGFFITFIPLYYGSRAGYHLTAVPVSVLRGMVNVFIAIVVIEVLSLVARFL